MTRRGATPAAATAALLLAALVLSVLETGPPAGVVRLWFFLQVAPMAPTALVLARQRPGHPVCRLLVLCTACLAAGTAAEGLLYRSVGSVPDAVLAGLQAVQLGGQLGAFAALAALLAVFPTGVADSRAARVLQKSVGPIAAAVTVLTLTTRQSWAFTDSVAWRPLPARFPLYVPALHALQPLAAGLLVAAPMVLLTVGLVLLYGRRSRVEPGRRAAVRSVWWTSMVAVAISVLIMTLGGVGVLSQAVVAAIPCMFLIPIGMGVATLRDDAFDLDLLLRRTLLYAGLSAGITVTCAAVAAVVGLTAAARLPLTLAVLAAVAATVALGPVSRRFERLAGRWAYGERVSGYDLLFRVGAALEHAYDLGELAPRLAEMVREGLGVRWARVRVALTPGLMETLGEAGEPIGACARSMPLVHAGILVGTLDCGPRIGGVLTAADDDVLSGLARQAALAVHNARLAAELAGRLDEIGVQASELTASRERLVSAQDVERQRLERDLHDGAKQEIVALMAKLRMARNRLARGEESGLGELLEELQGDARTVLDDLRELAHGIRPPVLSDQGLVRAIEARAARLPLDVTIEAEPAMAGTRFADEVEGAAWFVVSEACANALKHSGAARLVISLRTAGGRLVLRVDDDGCGIAAAAAAVGLRPLRDRVAALGGTLAVTGRPGSGTTVEAVLPARARTPAAVRA